MEKPVAPSVRWSVAGAFHGQMTETTAKVTIRSTVGAGSGDALRLPLPTLERRYTPLKANENPCFRMAGATVVDLFKLSNRRRFQLNRAACRVTRM
ncbi:hypothetical protein [Sphingomonas sp. CFBP 13720]|uniref:hypothetical protein n=1 Tax=Sphingomonas sp. CFBP 13720 TaxID=2775302 RepID=UPI00177CFCEB|nr:hypothetical protein [Sphingomonas sp. CFBP 13720]MBD8677818.1 hypothetical protein [Sphingomonas sp. CFBP 13720]